MVKRLYVAMNNNLVGTWDYKSNGDESFQYFDSWINNPYSRGISLSMPVRKEKYSNQIVNNYFSNLIPERKEIIELFLKKYKIRKNNTFELLAEIGRDCIGAIQISDNPDFLTAPQEIKGEPINETRMASILRNSQVANTHIFFNEDDVFRISLTGAQNKTAFLYHQGAWNIPIGSTPTTHIFKLPIGKVQNQIDLFQSVENEWYCCKLFNNMGLSTAKSNILTFEDQKVLAVERFDRIIEKKENKIIRLPQEDFCQVLNVPPQLKYQNDNGPSAKDIMDILKNSNGLEDPITFYKALILNWLIAATDAHAKNYSIFINRNNSYSLTPLYDIMSFAPYIGNKKNQVHKSKVKLAMSVRGSSRNKYHIDKVTLANWYNTGSYLDLSQKVYKRVIEEIIDQLPLALEKTNSQIPTDFPSLIADSISLVAKNHLDILKSSY